MEGDHFEMIKYVVKMLSVNVIIDFRSTIDIAFRSSRLKIAEYLIKHSGHTNVNE